MSDTALTPDALRAAQDLAAYDAHQVAAFYFELTEAKRMSPHDAIALAAQYTLALVNGRTMIFVQQQASKNAQHTALQAALNTAMHPGMKPVSA